MKREGERGDGERGDRETQGGTYNLIIAYSTEEHMDGTTKELW